MGRSDCGSGDPNGDGGIHTGHLLEVTNEAYEEINIDSDGLYQVVSGLTSLHAIAQSGPPTHGINVCVVWLFR